MLGSLERNSKAQSADFEWRGAATSNLDFFTVQNFLSSEKNTHLQLGYTYMHTYNNRILCIV